MIARGPLLVPNFSVPSFGFAVLFRQLGRAKSKLVSRLAVSGSARLVRAIGGNKAARTIGGNKAARIPA